MNEPQKRQITAKKIALVAAVAIVMAVVITLVQDLIFGRANIAVTGGIVGAICAFLFTTQIRKSSN